MSVRSFIVAALLVGCASSPPPGATPPPAPPAPASAETELRALADRTKGFVLAALEHRPLPPVPPRAPDADDRNIVDARDELPDVSQLDFFLFTIDFIFFPTKDENSGVRVIVILTRAGIRIAQLKAPAYVGSRPSPLPDWLAALRPLSTMICDAVRANRTNALVFGEADRALINDDGAFRLIGELRPTPADIQGVTARINGSGSTSAVGFAVFQFGWLARAPGGDLFGFLVKLDPEGYVSGHPTVKSQRVGGRDLSPPTTPLK